MGLILHGSFQIKDCNVLASKLFFILDDLLWVLTDSQLKAIIHYAKSLSEAMEKSAQQRKSRTAESLQVLVAFSSFDLLNVFIILLLVCRWSNFLPSLKFTLLLLKQYNVMSFFIFVSRFRLLRHLLAFTPFGQTPHQLTLAPPAAQVNISITMTLRSLLTTPSCLAWTYTFATTALQWMKVIQKSQNPKEVMMKLVNNLMWSFHRWATPTRLTRGHAADIQEARFWLLSCPQTWWDWFYFWLFCSQRLCPAPTVTTAFIQL